MSQAEFDVFLSHNSADKPDVLRLATKLKEMGFNPWVDAWHLIAGEPWLPAISRALQNCGACAVIVGPGGLGNVHEDEMWVALQQSIESKQRDRRFRVIPILLPNSTRGDRARMPTFLTANTWVEFQRSIDEPAALDKLAKAIRGAAPGTGITLTSGECPFRGLEYFDVKHASLFFGREALTDWLLSRLRGTASRDGATRFLAIVGASGSGKSSLARAGVLARLGQGELPGSARWPLVICRPESRPLENLATALANTDGVNLGTGLKANLIGQLVENLLKSPEQLHLVSQGAMPTNDPDWRLVVFVDQFEELFTLNQPNLHGVQSTSQPPSLNPDRVAFFQNLLRAAMIENGRTIVILTMRADFYGKCAAFSELATAVSQHQELVGPMNAEELRRAIETPVQLSGSDMESGLVDLLTHEVANQPGALPQLQYVLAELWQKSRDLGFSKLTTSAYRELGGWEGALSKRADAVLGEFRAASQEDVCRQLFLRLVQPGEGTEDTKRLVRWQELPSATPGEKTALEQTVRKLADNRLITTSGDTLNSDSTLEVVHESLIRSWPKLRQWLDADRAGLQLHRRLTETASEWAKSNAEKSRRDATLLYAGTRLASAAEWAKKNGTALNDLEREFLGASEGVLQQRRRSAVKKWTGSALAILLLSVFGWFVWANDRDRTLARGLVDKLSAADIKEVPGILSDIKSYRKLVSPQLTPMFQDAKPDTNEKLNAAFAIVADGQTIDADMRNFLRERLLKASPGPFAVMCTLMPQNNADLIKECWDTALDKQQPTLQRFHAGCALARLDSVDKSGNWNNSEFTHFIAEQLVAATPEHFGAYKELFIKVGPKLVPALSDLFKDSNRTELARSLPASLLADYAADDLGTLTELVLKADPISDRSLFPALKKHPEAKKNLEAVLDQHLKPDWKDAAPPAAWIEPSQAVRKQIEKAHGLIAERFAFCQDMPLSEFPDVAETLRASGYRPTRVRPWKAHHAERDGYIGAVWARDSQRWHIDASLKKSDLPAPDAPASKDGLLLTDIAPLAAADEAAEPEFIALWSESRPASATAPGADGSEGEQRRVMLDLTDAELTAAQTTLTEQGFTSQSTITVRTDSSGQRHYTGIWSNQGAPSELRPDYPGFELVAQPQWDVAVAPAGKLADPLDTYRRQLDAFEARSPEELNDPQVREIRATAHYKLGNLEPALADLDFVLAQAGSLPPSPASLAASDQILKSTFLQYRALTLARLGRTEKAEECLDKYLATDVDASFKSYVQIQVLAWLGEFEQASAELASAITASRPNTNDLYDVVCAAALLSQALAAKDSAQSQKIADRTIELLQQLIAQGHVKAERLKSDADLASLHGDPRFIELLRQMELPAAYAALWRADVDFESKLLAKVPMDDVLGQIKPLIAQGFRPFAIAMDVPQRTQISGLTPTARQKEIAVEPEQPSTVPSPSGKGETVIVASAPPGPTRADRPDEGSRAPSPLCSLILHRPLIPDEAKESLALQQAAAATALLRLNAAGKVWPLFQDQPDPRLRSYVLHRLAKYDVDPQSLLTQLYQKSDVSRRRSLILGIGEFAKGKLLSKEQQAEAINDLANRYANDPDPGIHGAAEWTLRQLGAQTAIAKVQKAYSTGTVDGDRRWYLTKTGKRDLSRSASPAVPPDGAAEAGSLANYDESVAGITFAIIEPTDDFLMGSPVSEEDRSFAEIRHKRRIGRKFAISTHEITVGQFQRFQNDDRSGATTSPTDDLPAILIDWYKAAAYCNWLSKQEGLPPEQWCYDLDQEFAEGMSLVPDYLHRIGYRLPSEAEWEYACRARTTTARYFGEGETLLEDYANVARWLSSVGGLRPNGFGLFDMYGNVWEWCQDEKLDYDTYFEILGDREQTGMLSDSGDRVLRGGSFLNTSSTARSANRYNNRPAGRNDLDGFRVGRTLPPVLLTALHPAKGGKNLGIDMNHFTIPESTDGRSQER